MTQEDKILLAKDLFCRALSGVKVNYKGNVYTLGYNMYLKDGDVAFESYPMMYFLEGVEEVKPYLRPIDSMTDSEGKEFIEMMCDNRYCQLTDWFNSHHFDYRGLIEKGLALEAPEDMY